MKFLAVICAGLVATAAVTPVTIQTADAAPRWGNNGNHGWKWKKVCTVRWWHGRKHKVCRMVKVRRW